MSVGLPKAATTALFLSFLTPHTAFCGFYLQGHDTSIASDVLVIKAESKCSDWDGKWLEEHLQCMFYVNTKLRKLFMYAQFIVI